MVLVDFYLHNRFCRTVALGSAQLLTGIFPGT